jgi:hypothetical protein
MDPISMPEPFQQLPFTLERELLQAEDRVTQTRVEIPGVGDFLLKGTKVAVFGAKPLAEPWTIYLKYFASGWKVGVSNQSDVYDGITWTKCPVTGLLEDPDNENDSGWAAPRTGFLFLWGTVNTDGEVTSIVLKNDQASLADIKRVDSAAGKQTKFAYVIGYLWSEQIGSTVQWYVRQEASRHVTLMYVVVNGVLCKVPFEM